MSLCLPPSLYLSQVKQQQMLRSAIQKLTLPMYLLNLPSNSDLISVDVLPNPVDAQRYFLINFLHLSSLNMNQINSIHLWLGLILDWTQFVGVICVPSPQALWVFLTISNVIFYQPA